MKHAPTTELSPGSIAALRFSGGEPVDTILEDVVGELRHAGCRLGGFLQREIADGENCCSITYLENLSDGTMVRISQPLGSGSKGCRLNPHALAELAGTVLADLERGVDIIVLNRFGKGESDGHGFRQVIEKAFLAGVPVLTAVRDTYADAWNEFGAEFAVNLPADAAAVAKWCRAVLASEVADLEPAE